MRLQQPPHRGPPGFFVTGTDTGVGKTVVACALLRALAQRGAKAVGMKPVAAGGERLEGRVLNEDVAALAAAGSVEAALETINPYAFEQPIAPHIAAEREGVTIKFDAIRGAFRALAAGADFVVVEGAGGFRVPLGPSGDTGDLARLLGLPMILVVGMRLGCLNHALLSAESIRAAGLPFAGWVANHIDPEMLFPEENVATLCARLGAPLLARVPHSPAADADALAQFFDVDTLAAFRG